jgi:hypothetical protein
MVKLLKLKTAEHVEDDQKEVEQVLKDFEAAPALTASSLRQRVVITFVVNLSTLICFGMLFPPLAFVIALSIWRELVSIKMVLGKLHCVLQSLVDLSLKQRVVKFQAMIHRELFDAEVEIVQGVWYGVCVASSIWGFVLFDTLSALMGAIASIWIAVLMGLSPYIAYLLLRSMQGFFTTNQPWRMKSIRWQHDSDINNPVFRDDEGL